MTLPTLTPPPAHRRKRWRWLRRIFLATIATISVVMWRNYTYERAVRQLREAGIVFTGRKSWGLAEWWKAVRTDWRYFPSILDAVKPDENRWSMDTASCANVPPLQNLDAVSNALRRVNPKRLELGITPCETLQNLEGLKGLTNLETLDLDSCKALRNLDALKHLSSLRHLSIQYPTALENLDGIKGLKSLTWLTLDGRPALQSVDALQELTALTTLDLFNCAALKNVDVLKNLKALRYLDLTGCSELQSIDGLKGLALTSVKLWYCEKLSAESIAALTAALPNTEILAP